MDVNVIRIRDLEREVTVTCDTYDESIDFVQCLSIELQPYEYENPYEFTHDEYCQYWQAVINGEVKCFIDECATGLTCSEASDQLFGTDFDEYTYGYTGCRLKNPCGKSGDVGNGKLSAGSIAGIVVGALVGVACLVAIIALIICFCCMEDSSSAPNQQPPQTKITEINPGQQGDLKGGQANAGPEGNGNNQVQFV